MQMILDQFKVGRVEESEFRYCGKEVKQDPDGSISVRCEHTTNKLTPISYNKRALTDPCTEAEVSQLKSVTDP